MSVLYRSTFLPFLLLGSLWIAVRVYPIHQSNPAFSWEGWQAHKLLAYGFWHRHGAPIDAQYQTGILPDPSRYNYVDHPLPIVWWDTFLVVLGGPRLLEIFDLLIKLASFLLFFQVLKTLFCLRAAALASTLLLLAPVPLTWDADSNAIASGALLWSIVLFLISRAGKSSLAHQRLPFTLGAAVFVGGQVSWMTLSLVPALLVATDSRDVRYTFSGLWAEWRGNAVWRGVCLGAAATSILFIAMLCVYSAGLVENLHYILMQAGVAQQISKSKMLLFDGLRPAVWSGASLCLFGGVGFFLCFREKGANRIVFAAATYLIIFVSIGLMLTKFYFTETSPYVYFSFALAILSGFAFQKLPGRWVPVVAIALALPNLAYAYLSISIPGVSSASVALGQAVERQTGPTDLILTNLEPQRSPFSPTDMSIPGEPKKIADRFMRFGVKSLEDARDVNDRFPAAPKVFALAVELPVAQDLRDLLQRATPIAREQVVFEVESPGLAQKIRMTIWKLNGKAADRDRKSVTGEQRVDIQFYRLPQ